VTAYRFRAARLDGRIVRGVVQATTAAQANRAITELGLLPVAVDATGYAPCRAASRRDLAVVFRSVAVLSAAGIPLERALATTEALAPRALRAVLHTARTRLREGQGLAQALGGDNSVVPGVVLGMIRAGERASRLGHALEQVATHLEQEAEFVARMRQALAYPLLLAGVGTLSVFAIAVVVVPRFAELLGDLGQELPLATRALLGGSRLLARAWFAIPGLALGAAWATREVLQRPAARRRVDELLLGLPVLGPLRLALGGARGARALGSALDAGLPLLAALAVAGEAAGDTAVAARLGRARERVARGEPLAASLQREEALGASALQLVAVGEASGRLAAMAGRAGDLAAQEADRRLKTLLTVLEPALIVLFGGIVAFVAAALLQAVYALRPGGL
jgi:type II secretory pathway component PulF